MQQVSDKILDYLHKKYNIKSIKRGKITYFLCPFCKKEPLSATIIPFANKFNCLNCKRKGDIFYLVRELEQDKKDFTDEQIVEYLAKLLNLNIVLPSELEKVITFYSLHQFDLLPLTPNGKIPIEKDWGNQSHKDKQGWLNWIKEGLNIGVKCGAKSNITVIDIDDSVIPEEIAKIKGDPLIQKTNRGWHLFYLYEKDLPTTRIDDLKIDILNDGKQVIVYPSIIDNYLRKFVTPLKLERMPEELKELIKQRITIPSLKTKSEQIQENINTEDFNLAIIDEGNRNNFLIHLGGILRKQLNISQTDYVLNVINRHFCKPPLPQREVNYIIRSLDRYINKDINELCHKILEYLRIVEEAHPIDIRQALGISNQGEEKKRLDEALAFLVKEGYLIKGGVGRGVYYKMLFKVQWRDTFVNESREINFKMPYFDDIAIFRDGDLLILGAGPKIGKSHLCMNIIKRLVNQGIKPYYVNLESGNRFVNIALALGLKEGDFYWTVSFDPEQIELEDNAVTLIDWISPKDFAKTDKIFKRLSEQVFKHRGVLITFMQLRENGEFFAKDLIPQFPAFIAKYFYEKEDDGTYGYFDVEYMREPKINRKRVKIPCVYNFETKELKRLDELKNELER